MNADQKARYKELKRKYRYRKFQDVVNKICVEMAGMPIEVLKEQYSRYSAHKVTLYEMFGDI